ncbi:MAG: DUF5615 family PIN-like protein [Chitinophagaceae bacterium]
MKFLLDENLPTKVKYDFGEGYEIWTVRDMGWLGKKNDELLGLAAFNGFDFFRILLGSRPYGKNFWDGNPDQRVEMING